MSVKIRLNPKIRGTGPKITLAHTLYIVGYGLIQKKMGLVCLRNRLLFSNTPKSI